MNLPAIPKWVIKDSVSLEAVITRFKYGKDLEELGQVIQGEALYVLKTEVHKDKQTGWGKVVAEFAITVGSKLTQQRANKLIDLYELYDPEICIPYKIDKIKELKGTTVREKAVNYEEIKLAVSKERPSTREIREYNITLDTEPRQFNMNIRSRIYLASGGQCARCRKFITWDDYECDHIKPYSLGGATIIDNAQALCRHCNRSKSSHWDMPTLTIQKD